jgi:hypothetical protein
MTGIARYRRSTLIATQCVLLFVCVSGVDAEPLASRAFGSLVLAPSLEAVPAMGVPTNAGQLNDRRSVERIAARFEVDQRPEPRPVPMPARESEVARYRTGRPGALVPLYVSLATLNFLDAHSTFQAVDAGAYEANPIVGSFVDNRAAVLALKAGVTTGTILLSELMWKQGRRKASIAMLTALTLANAFIVQHNYRVASSLR